MATKSPLQRRSSNGSEPKLDKRFSNQSNKGRAKTVISEFRMTKPNVSCNDPKPDLKQIAREVLKCAQSHEANVMLIGNVRADEIVLLAQAILGPQLDFEYCECGC